MTQSPPGKLRIRYTGALEALSPEDVASMLARTGPETPAEVSDRVARIGERVRAEGDGALLELTRKYDNVELTSIEVPPARLANALATIDSRVRHALERAARNIAVAHRAELPIPHGEVEVEPGVFVGRRAEPLLRVGVYAPGGRAAYPSSVLMGVVAARVAGVREIIVASPPGPSGAPSSVVLAAAAIGGATKVVAVGGAQAVFAMSYGTKSVPRVDRIVGPGNAYVAEAKRQVAGHVGIDSPAGPSEIIIIADDSADPEHLARELVAQAEHDPEASCIALATSEALASAIVRALEDMTPGRADVVAQSLGSRGAVLSVSSLDAALALAERYAGEHVLVATRDAAAVAARIHRAGTVFYGPGASVAFGDYMTGSNHVLPTAGAAARWSGLGVLDFLRWTSYQRIERDAAARMASDVGILADAEGLPGHAAAARAFVNTAVPPAKLALRPRASVEALSVYTSNRRPAEIDLSDNTNQRGAAPSAQALAATDAARAAIPRYPSHYADDLKAAIAAHLGVEPSSVVTGCGSDDVLDCAVRAFASPGAALAFSEPTFAMIPHIAHATGVTPRPVPFRSAAEGYDIDPERLLEGDAGIIYVCTPNNPTGTIASTRALERMLERARGLVIVDEAYVDYGGASALPMVLASERAVVVRTFSKAYGLAGMRVGYAVGAPSVVAHLEKVRGPYKVGGLAERMAVRVLSDETEWVRANITEVLAARTRFVEWLTERGLAPIPSHANFVLLPISRAAERAARLRERGIAVRAFPALSHFGDALRISVGPWDVMERTLAAFAEELA
ncbi:MAG: histidinol dehydrogenase [Polyangiaceae bacterium]